MGVKEKKNKNVLSMVVSFGVIITTQGCSVIS